MKNLDISAATVSGTLKDVGVGESMGNSGERLDGMNEVGARKGGLGFGMTSFFIVAQMAGAGFLALPRATADAGWAGIALIIIFCISIGFSATRLGRCWVMLEERWPEYKKPSRQPYMDLAFRSLGIHGRLLALLAVLITLTGSTIVFIILIAEMMFNLVPSVSQCGWTVIVAGVVLPTTWLGTPKDFWQASVLAVLSTVVAVVVILAKILVDNGGISDSPPFHPNPSVSSFSLGFGAILFSFGGASVFPTIQNDMRKRSDFWKSVLVSFVVILAMYIPVAVVGYTLIGDSVKSNILLSVKPGFVVIIAIAMQIVNLIGTFIISFNPVAQSIEDIVGAPSTFGWQRVGLRSGIIVFELLIALAIPDFGLILNLIGGSTITCLSFIFPPLMYMKLVDDKSDKQWPERTIPLWERIYLWTIVCVGIVGGISATTSALMAIINPESFKRSCFLNFSGIES